MNILVIGSGGREHAILWSLSKSHLTNKLYVAPGNAGTSDLAINLPIPSTDKIQLANAVKTYEIDLTIVGPENSLSEGIVDYFQDQNLLIVGPTKKAAQIETSKSFAKKLMNDHKIPTGAAEIFELPQAAKDYLTSATFPLVIKADGLAAGKGVVICENIDQAMSTVERFLVTQEFGPAGKRILVEEFLTGREVSVFGITDGNHLSPLIAACDYKRLLNDNLGPNTGGMGSYSPPEFWSESLSNTIRNEIMIPTINAMKSIGHPFKGVLYAGIILTNIGPKVLEFNCRFGDPEAVVILPRLKSDPVKLFYAMAEGSLNNYELEWSNRACVAIVLASKGYPEHYQTGIQITGLEKISPDATVFHAGTKSPVSPPNTTARILTNGGRVLTIMASGESIENAREKAYLGVNKVTFSGAHYRTDIALLNSYQ